MGLLGRGGPATRRARSLKSGVLSLPDTHAHADPHPALWWWLLWSSPPPLAARRMHAARERRARARGGQRRRASPSRTPHRARTQHTQGREQRARQRRRCMRAAGRWDGTSRTRQHARGARGTRERALAPGADARRATRTSVSFDTPREGSQSPPARPAAPPLPSRTGRGRAPVATSNRVFGPRSPRRRTSGRRGLRGHRRPAS